MMNLRELLVKSRLVKKFRRGILGSSKTKPSKYGQPEVLGTSCFISSPMGASIYAIKMFLNLGSGGMFLK